MDWITKEHETSQSPLEATLRGPCGTPFLAVRRRAVRSTANMGTICRGFKRVRNGPKSPSASLQFDPAAAVGAEQMQLFARRGGPDALADRRRLGSRNPHDDFAGR